MLTDVAAAAAAAPGSRVLCLATVDRPGHLCNLTLGHDGFCNPVPAEQLPQPGGQS